MSSALKFGFLGVTVHLNFWMWLFPSYQHRTVGGFSGISGTWVFPAGECTEGEQDFRVRLWRAIRRR